MRGEVRRAIRLNTHLKYKVMPPVGLMTLFYLEF
jgi:hypothetical protein